MGKSFSIGRKTMPGLRRIEAILTVSRKREEKPGDCQDRGCSQDLPRDENVGERAVSREYVYVKGGRECEDDGE